MDTLDQLKPTASANAGSEFYIFSKAVEARFREISNGELYFVDAVDLFDTYLASFPAGTNPIYRVRTEHDCSCCKNFVRNIGHVVALQGGTVLTVWDVDVPAPYDAVAKAMADYVRSLPVKSVLRTKETKFGAPYTNELNEDGSVRRWNHFFCDVPTRNRSATPEAARGEINSVIQVFRRGVEELTADSIESVMDLIASNALYRGAEFKGVVEAFRELHTAYPRNGSQTAKDTFLWSNVGNGAARFRNTVIGTLVTDLSEGVDLEHAVRSFEGKVAPLNYKRPTTLITKKMIDDAVAKLKSLDLETAIERRFARVSDVSVNNVLFVDNSVKSQMKDGLAGLLMDHVKPTTVDIKNAEPITVDEFLSRIVPQATSIDLLLQNKHASNFMSLTAPVHADAGRLFKWDNSFAWSYDGDAADGIKQRVKKAGGKIDADLRVSLAWFNYDDLDLHVIEPGGSHIYYGSRAGTQGGRLDVDMNAGGGSSREPVENITWNGKIFDGRYRVAVHNFARRETIDVGFTLEIEYAGNIRQFTYSKAINNRDQIDAISLNVKNGALVSVEVSGPLTEGTTSQDKWGVKTETLVPVDTLLASPNHWDGQDIGNKHWFFILKDCKNPNPARGIYNEFLKSSLDPHRKVFEVLGAKTKCPVVDDQLSGVGFSSTRSDNAIVVVKGNSINKAFNITF